MTEKKESKAKKEEIQVEFIFEGNRLEQIDRREFETGKDVFKISRWEPKGIKPYEWYFKNIKKEVE